MLSTSLSFIVPTYYLTEIRFYQKSELRILNFSLFCTIILELCNNAYNLNAMKVPRILLIIKILDTVVLERNVYTYSLHFAKLLFIVSLKCRSCSNSGHRKHTIDRGQCKFFNFSHEHTQKVT